MDLTTLQKMLKEQPSLTSDMENKLAELHGILSNPEVRKAFDNAISTVSKTVEDGGPNPWIDKTVDYFEAYFRTWFTFLPVPNGGLGMIIPFSQFYLDNQAGADFLNCFESQRSPSSPRTTEIFNWIAEFVDMRGKFMDSPASGIHIDAWMKDLGPKEQDFLIPEGGFQTFNAFFSRKLNPATDARPIANPDDDAVAVAPADSDVNYIISDLTLGTKLNVKTRHLDLSELLSDSDYAVQFVGGTAISCVLLPENYHHFHAPVSGEIVESGEVDGALFGVVDGNNFVNRFNLGQGTTDFSVFERFHRAYFVIRTERHGYVAVVPVGLNTISAIHPSLTCGHSKMVPKGAKPVPVKKGEDLGYFSYGGSLVILLFQNGVLPAVSLQMGNRLGARGTPIA